MAIELEITHDKVRVVTFYYCICMSHKPDKFNLGSKVSARAKQLQTWASSMRPRGYTGFLSPLDTLPPGIFQPKTSKNYLATSYSTPSNDKSIFQNRSKCPTCGLNLQDTLEPISKSAEPALRDQLKGV